MKKNLFLSLLVIFFASLAQLQATPVFAKQYNQKCNACHSMMPTLNATGQRFLRNGFRFSKDDPTMLSNVLDAKDNASRLLPFSGLIGINTDTKARKIVEKVNMYFGGSVTDTISAYAITRSNFNTKKNHNLFGDTNSRAFIQYNPKGNEHVVKVGWMYPLTQFGNSGRMIMDNGLMGSGLVKKAPKSAIKPSFAKQPPLPPKPGANATPQELKKYAMMTMPKEPYKLPSIKSGISAVKGVEYSYLYDESILFLANAGIPTSMHFATDDDFQVTVGAQLFQSDHGYNFGFIYTHQDLGNISLDSYMIPLEKDFFDGQFTYVANLVYTDSDQYFNPYYGIENTFVYQMDDDTQVRAILSFDKDEAKESNSGYSVTYSKLWKQRYLLHLSGARIKGVAFDESLAKLSLYMFM